MPTSVSLFDYNLQPEFIAQHSVEPRDQAKLLVLDRTSGNVRHWHVFDLPSLLRAGDVLVFNNTKVFKARLEGRAGENTIELFLLKEIEAGKWEALVKPGKRVVVGSEISLGMVSPIKVLKKNMDGTVVLDMGCSREDVLRYCDEHGEVPIPPYVGKSPEAFDSYQTVYAKELGAVAAPTAGFHFTQRLLNELKAIGMQIEFVTLHVGLGTFRPVQTETLEEHQMHAECVSIDQGTADRINTAKREGRRIIAVGTTVVRVLEGVAVDHLPPSLYARTGDLNLFIMPGFKFKIIDGLITNFHLPKSTLIALVSAFAGREQILSAYEEAKRMSYRFYSFGDAMFIYDAW
ncbi:MAG: tRNA preQ1(34) S-adenosylmethionine ribosyltransferase-isomerase QueA [Patescibacteria group bacterium]